MDILDAILKYAVAPIMAFIWTMQLKINQHHTDIEVLKAQAVSTKEAHDREFKELRENFRRVFEKLDGIEQAMRK